MAQMFRIQPVSVGSAATDRVLSQTRCAATKKLYYGKLRQFFRFLSNDPNRSHKVTNNTIVAAQIDADDVCDWMNTFDVTAYSYSHYNTGTSAVNY